MKVAKKVFAILLVAILLLSVFNISSLISIFAADQSNNYITVLKQDFEGEGIAGYYSKAEHGYHNDYRSVGFVTGEGIGNNGSNSAIILGFGRNNATNAEGTNKPAFNVCSTSAYNGRNVGESFRLKELLLSVK